jgi:hypothetical protein
VSRAAPFVNNKTKYVAVLLVLLAAFGLHYAGARWSGLAGGEAGRPADYAGFSTPRVVAAILPPWAVPLFPTAFLFTLTAMGIVTRVIWEPPEGTFWTRLWKTVKALMLSPLVLYSILGMATQQPDAVVAGLFAFQNGFFWQSVLQGRSFNTDLKK